jgi:hypothetical protein
METSLLWPGRMACPSERVWVVPVALICMVQLCTTTPHPSGVRDMTQRWAESQVGEVSRQAQAAAMARGQKEPGTLLLTMIVKNEAERLDTSLPACVYIFKSWLPGHQMYLDTEV